MHSHRSLLILKQQLQLVERADHIILYESLAGPNLHGMYQCHVVCVHIHTWIRVGTPVSFTSAWVRRGFLGSLYLIVC